MTNFSFKSDNALTTSLFFKTERNFPLWYLLFKRRVLVFTFSINNDFQGIKFSIGILYFSAIWTARSSMPFLSDNSHSTKFIFLGSLKFGPLHKSFRRSVFWTIRKSADMIWPWSGSQNCEPWQSQFTNSGISCVLILCTVSL